MLSITSAAGLLFGPVPTEVSDFRPEGLLASSAAAAAGALCDFLRFLRSLAFVTSVVVLTCCPLMNTSVCGSQFCTAPHGQPRSKPRHFAALCRDVHLNMCTCQQLSKVWELAANTVVACSLKYPLPAQ